MAGGARPGKPSLATPALPFERLTRVMVTLMTLLVWAVVITLVEWLAGPYRRRFGDLSPRSRYRAGAVFVLGGLVSGMCLRLLLSRSTDSWIGGTLMAVFVVGLWAAMAAEVRRVSWERRAQKPAIR